MPNSRHSSLPPSSPLSSIPSSWPSTPTSHRLLVPTAGSATLLLSSHTPYTPRARAASLGPISSDGLFPTPPHVGTKAQRNALARQSGARKRALTMQSQEEEAEQRRLKRIVEEDERAHARALRKSMFFDTILSNFNDCEYTVGEFLLYISDPIYKQRRARWEGLFRDRNLVRDLLDLWAFKSTPMSREQVHAWAVDYVSKQVKREARQITSDGTLQTLKRNIDSKFVLGFEIGAINSYLQEKGSVFMRVLDSLATSTRQIRTATAARFAKKKNVVTSAALALLGEYSNSNNWSKKIIGMYLYSAGIQKQALAVMTHIGVSESYDSITAKKRKRATPRPVPITSIPVQPSSNTLVHQATEEKYEIEGGSLRRLSISMVDTARQVAATGLFGTSYDNINMVFRAAEQIVGRKDAQENGTCTTIWPLFKAAPEKMKVADLEAAFMAAGPLDLSDIILDEAEALTLRNNLVHCILRIAVGHGGAGFKKFTKDLESSLPCSKHKIELHKTSLHPLPAFEIDESTIVGGAEVIDAIFEVLSIKKAKNWLQTVKIFCGDQLTIARLRSLVNIRAGHEGGYTGFGWGVWMPGLFHAKMADVHGFFVAHFGKAPAGPRNPGSLAFHNTIIQRKPIIMTSLPPFRTCRDLIFVSLYARILHCFLLLSKFGSLEEYSEDLTWTQLECDAQILMDTYTNADTVAELRRQRQAAKPGTRAGDMVYENAILFLRDALLTREFTDAIKAGDSGRIVLVLKTWALSYRGSGRTKYAHEMLHLIHNITTVWPKDIRDIVFNNWLVNPSGKPNSWVEVDLMQEHMNYWIKNFYRAHGSSASWEWLEMIAPCVNILRQLAQNFKHMLGTDLGTAHHPMDLTVDIPDLMESLDHYEVYIEKTGRYLDNDDTCDPDIVTEGFLDLVNGPLADYNKAFVHLKARRRLMPLIWEEALHTESVTTDPRARTTLPHGLNSNNIEAQPAPQTDFINDEEVEEEVDEEVEEENAEEIEDCFEEAEDETLLLESAADVSLDMDAEDMASYFRNGNNSESESDEEELEDISSLFNS